MPSLSLLVFLTIFLGGCLLTLFRDPLWGIIVYVLLYFIHPSVRWWGASLEYRFSLIITSLILFSFLLYSYRYRDNKLSDIPAFKWLIGLSIIVVAASLWAVSPATHSEVVTKYFKVLVFVLLLFKIIDSPSKMEALVIAYLLGIFYISWLGWQSGRTMFGRLELIAGPDVADANTSAALFVPAIPLLVYYTFFAKKRLIQLLALIELTFVMNCLILFNSRGAFLGIFTAGLFLMYQFLRYSKDHRLKMKFLFGFIVCICLFLYLTDDIFWDRICTLKDPNLNEVSRVNFWLKTFDMLKDHPLGLGGRGYEIVSQNYLPPEWLAEGELTVSTHRTRAVHSTWFEILSEYGYQGLFLFLGYIYETFVLMRKTKNYFLSQHKVSLFFQASALQAGFLGFLVCITFINFFYVEFTHWVLMLFAAYSNIYLLKPLNNNM